MANPRPRTDHLRRYQVTNPDEARALAALGSGRPAPERPLTPWSGKLYADQIDELRRRGVNVSELVRRLLDDHLAH